jgi:hypothetical protein
MASQGPTFVGAATSTLESPYDDLGWTGTGAQTATDDTYAYITSASFDAGIISYRARNTMSANAFTVPSDATITGVVVEMEHNWTAGTSAPNYALMQLVQAAARIGTDKGGAGLTVPTPEQFTSYGGSGDLWGAALTPTIVNSSTFGVDCAVQSNATDTDYYLDSVRLTVYYTPAGGEGFTGLTVTHRVG